MTQQEIDRKRQMAQMLLQARAPQMGQAGRFHVAPSAFAQIAPAIQQVTGGIMGKQADKGQQQLDDETKAKLAQSLMALTGVNGPGADVSPEKLVAVGALTQAPIAQQQQAVGQLSAQALAPPKQQGLLKVGQGDSIYDPNSREVVHHGSPSSEPLVDVIGPDGKPVKLPRSQAVGMQPYKPSGVTVNTGDKIGSIPQGYMLIDGPNGPELSPIPGGPADTSEADAANQSLNEQKGDVVTQEIGRVMSKLDEPSLPETGLFGNMLKGVPGTDAHAVQNYLETIKSNVGFDRLQQMREASPTGGALGQVSERELSTLQAVLGSLEQSQSAEDLQYNLARLHNMYQDVIHGPGGGAPRMPLSEKQEPEQQAAPIPDLKTLSDEELQRIAAGG